MSYSLVTSKMEVIQPDQPTAHDKHKFHKRPDWETMGVLSEMLELCWDFLLMRVAFICISVDYFIEPDPSLPVLHRV